MLINIVVDNCEGVKNECMRVILLNFENWIILYDKGDNFCRDLM